MSYGEWYVALFCLGAGISISAFWTAVVLRGRLAILLPDVPGAREHALAELLAGIALVAAGASLIAADDAAWAIALTGIALGGLAYALVNSPGLYRDQPRMRAAFIVGWVFTIPAIVLLFLNVV